MKTNVKTVFYCDFCKKHTLTKTSMALHEERCMRNPDNRRACEGCIYIESVKVPQTRFGFDGNETEYEVMVNTFRCKKLNKLLYPPIAEHKGLPNSYPEQFENQEAMPRECLHAAFVKDIFQ